jgi:hypothetical protein
MRPSVETLLEAFYATLLTKQQEPNKKNII